MRTARHELKTSHAYPTIAAANSSSANATAAESSETNRKTNDWNASSVAAALLSTVEAVLVYNISDMHSEEGDATHEERLGLTREMMQCDDTIPKRNSMSFIVFF